MPLCLVVIFKNKGAIVRVQAVDANQEIRWVLLRFSSSKAAKYAIVMVSSSIIESEIAGKKERKIFFLDD
jgi:hypothetical protein